MISKLVAGALVGPCEFAAASLRRVVELAEREQARMLRLSRRLALKRDGRKPVMLEITGAPPPGCIYDDEGYVVELWPGARHASWVRFW